MKKEEVYASNLKTSKKVKCIILGSSTVTVNIEGKTTGDEVELDPKKAEDYVKKKLVRYKNKKEREV